MLPCQQENEIVPSENFGLTIPVDDFCGELLKHEQVDCPVIHRFGPGIYIREFSVPAGTFVVGHYHKTDHMNVFLKGRVTMLNEDGTTSDLKAPVVFTGGPGRKMGLVTEDMVQLTIHATEETDIETLEEMYLDKSLALDEMKSIRLKAKRVGDIEGFARIVESTDAVETETDESYYTNMPFGGYKFSISDSSIHGKGVFASGSFEIGESVGPMKIDDKKTTLWRYTNHSEKPNAMVAVNGQGLHLMAIREIRGNQGGLLGDEITIDYSKDFYTEGEICQ